MHKPLSATNSVGFNQFLKDSVLLCLRAIFLDFEIECYFNPDAGRDWGQEEKGTTEDEMVGWHHRLDAHEFG